MTKRQLPNRPPGAPHSLGHLNVLTGAGARYITAPEHIATITMPITRGQALSALLTEREPAPVLEGMDALAAELLRRAQTEADLSRLVSDENQPFLTIGARLPLDLEVELDGDDEGDDEVELDGERPEPIDGAGRPEGGPYHAYEALYIGTGHMQGDGEAMLSCRDGLIYCHLVIEPESELAEGDDGPDGPFVHTDTTLLVNIFVVASPRPVLTFEEWCVITGDEAG